MPSGAKLCFRAGEQSQNGYHYEEQSDFEDTRPPAGRPEAGSADPGRSCWGGGQAWRKRAGQRADLPTSTFTFSSTAEMKRWAEGKSKAYIYTRYGNPSLAIAEGKIAALEEPRRRWLRLRAWRRFRTRC